MKKSKKTSGISALQLALIITGSIVAAAGIILLIVKLCKKKTAKKPIETADDDFDIDSWNIDEEFLEGLEIDDDELEGDSDEQTIPEDAIIDEADTSAEEI